jgi:glycosyltransferase 2 family protein
MVADARDPAYSYTRPAPAGAVPAGARARSPEMRQHFRTLLALAAAGGLLALFLRNTDFHLVGAEIVHADLWLLVAALGATALAYICRAFRWQYLLRPIGHVRYSNALRTTLIGFAASALLPARAGEVLRPYLLARREGLSATATFATIILERLLDTVTVLLLFAAFLLVFDTGLAEAGGRTFAQVKLGGALAAGASVAGLVIMFFLAGHPATLERLTRALVRVLPARLGEMAGRLVRAFADGLAIVRQPGRLLISLVLSLPLWLSIAAGIWLVTRAFHIVMPFTGAFLVQALLVVGVAVPTPGAVGGFHYFYRLGVTTFYGAPNDRAVGAALVLHAVSFVPVAITGLVLLAQEGLSLSRAGTLARGGAEEPA